MGGSFFFLWLHSSVVLYDEILKARVRSFTASPGHTGASAPSLASRAFLCQALGPLQTLRGAQDRQTCPGMGDDTGVTGTVQGPEAHTASLLPQGAVGSLLPSPAVLKGTLLSCAFPANTNIPPAYSTNYTGSR